MMTLELIIISVVYCWCYMMTLVLISMQMFMGHVVHCWCNMMTSEISTVIIYLIINFFLCLLSFEKCITSRKGEETDP